MHLLTLMRGEQRAGGDELCSYNDSSAGSPAARHEDARGREKPNGKLSCCGWSCSKTAWCQAPTPGSAVRAVLGTQPAIGAPGLFPMPATMWSSISPEI